MGCNRILLLVFAACAFWTNLIAVAAQAPVATQPLDDPLERLVPRTDRTEAEDDRLAAAAHFAAGRMLQQRQMQSEALRHYERALRYDGEAAPVLRELIPLAFSLDRGEEGLRYMIKFIDDANLDEALLIRAGELISESGQWEDAIKVYEHLAKQFSKESDLAQQLAVQLELGRLYFLTEQFSKSSSAFKQVLEGLEKPKGLDDKIRKAIAGEKGQTYELLGAAFLEAKQPDDARTAYKRLQEINPDATTDQLNSARVELAAGKPKEAIELLEKYLDQKTNITSVIPYEVLETALKELGQSQDLIPKLESLRSKQPDNQRLAYFLGRKYLESGNFEKAQPLLEAALAEKPAEQLYRALAELYRRSNQPAQLLKLFAQVLDKTASLSSLDDEAKKVIDDEAMLTALLDAAKKNHADAKPEDFNALKVAALLAGESKRWTDAETFFNLALKARLTANAELLLVWGVSLLLDDKSAEAAVVFQRGIDERALPDDKGSLHFYLAGALEMQGKTDEALLAANSAAGREPKNPEMASRPAWILYHAKRYDEAAAAYEAVLDMFADDFSTEGARNTVRQARSALSNINVLKGNVPKAVEWLEQLLDEFPDDVGASNDLGYLWADTNQHLNRAYAMAQYAAAEDPDNSAYRDSVGWALFRLGRYAEALAHLERAIDKEKPDGEVLDHVAEVQLKLGRDAEAQAAWTRAVEAFKKSGETEKMKAVEKKLADLASKTKASK